MNINECKYHLSFDIDWAPDFIVSDILNKLNAKNIKASFFITHESDIIKDIVKSGHNVGLHPNFLPNSSQGKNTMEIMDYLFNLYPEAISMRTHSLVQSSILLAEIFTNFPQLKYDLSIFMYKFPKIDICNYRGDKYSFKRINYNWEDDVAFWDPKFSWQKLDAFAETIVFDFHPVQIALNSCDLTGYNQLKSSLGNIPLWQSTAEMITKYQNTKYGAKTYFETVINSDMQSLSFDELRDI